MERKTTITLTLALTLSLSVFNVFMIPLSAQLTNSAQVTDPNEMVVGTIGEPQTVDPAECYDTASGELIMNVYDTLLWFDGEATDEFLPSLATSWSYDEETFTYTFKIRENVSWQDPAYGTVTPADVEYSFERWMVMDKDGGPTWMCFEPLLGVYVHDIDDPEFINKIDAAVESDDTNVYLHCVGPFPQMIVYQTFAQQWASVLDKEWAIEQACWDGVYTHESAQTYYNPAVSPLMDPEPVMMGQGPFIFDYWAHGLEWSIYKFDDYWQGWPAPGRRGYVTRVTEMVIDEWVTRKLMFLAGDLDFCYVPRMYMEDVWQQPGITCLYPLATLSTSGFFFNFDVQTTSRYLRPPFTSYECAVGELNEGGFPPDFFSDIHVRKGFAYCMDYIEFIEIAFLGEASEAVYPATPAIHGLPYRQSDEWYAKNQYTLHLAKAEGYFKFAWGGELWETGFTLTICYNSGNIVRKIIAEMLKANVEMLNPKFHVDVIEVEWSSAYIPELFNGELTLFVMGWLADYPDPHNFFHPFMHSEGAFAGWQFYSNPEVDALIEAGGTCVDPYRREEIYYELQELYIEECPGVCTHQATGRHWERDWVQGWYYNPIYSGNFFYDLWKEDLPMQDMNDDGDVNMMDIGKCVVAFGAYYELGAPHPRWDSFCDLNMDMIVNILDIAGLACRFGYAAPEWLCPTDFEISPLLCSAQINKDNEITGKNPHGIISVELYDRQGNLIDKRIQRPKSSLKEIITEPVWGARTRVGEIHMLIGSGWEVILEAKVGQYSTTYKFNRERSVQKDFGWAKVEHRPGNLREATIVIADPDKLRKITIKDNEGNEIHVHPYDVAPKGVRIKIPTLDAGKYPLTVEIEDKTDPEGKPGRTMTIKDDGTTASASVEGQNVSVDVARTTTDEDGKLIGMEKISVTDQAGNAIQDTNNKDVEPKQSAGDIGGKLSFSVKEGTEFPLKVTIQDRQGQVLSQFDVKSDGTCVFK